MRRSIRKRLRTRDPTKVPGSSPRFRSLLRHTPRYLEDSFASQPERRERPTRRPERQQILIRRGLALGAGLLILVLIVLGVRGCLNARKHRALSDYAGNVAQIVDETQQTSKSFFGKLEDPGKLSVTEFVAEVNADRSAMDNYVSRIDSLDTPGDMGNAQDALELVYELRGAAMTKIADSMSTALGEAGSKKATETIAKQMSVLAASDVLYAEVARPEINGVLADNGIDGDDVPKSEFVPEGSKWLDEGEVSSALASVSGSSGGSASPGVHGLGLLGTSINGTELSSEGTTNVSIEETPEVEVRVQNQGESTENGITVSVTVNGNTLTGDISSIEAGAEETVTIPLTPTPKGEATLEVEAEPVPGEEVSENNEASYTVVFE
jgi:CARDB